MNSHNPKDESVVIPESVQIATEREDVRVVNLNLSKASQLAIEEEPDSGSDPYNSTGQHVILKSKIERAE